MAFIEGTQLLTTKGWKDIDEVCGSEKVLIRNFLGDAKFETPFAIRKSHYNGNVIRSGSGKCCIAVTEDHKVFYTNKYGTGKKDTASEAFGKNGVFIQHKSRYSPDEYLPRRVIRFDERQVTVDTLSWYTFIGFVLRRSQITKDGMRLILTLDKNALEKDLSLICPILKKMRLKWNLVKPNRIVISQRHNIGRVLARLLGSRKRRDMSIPYKLMVDASIADARALIETFAQASKRSSRERMEGFQFVCSNKSLIDSLEVLGILCGYTTVSRMLKPAGTKIPAGETKRDSYTVSISPSTPNIPVTEREDYKYNGNVYDVDIFQTQLMVKEPGMLPVWMSPA